LNTCRRKTVTREPILPNGGQRAHSSRQDVLCYMHSDNPSYPCSKCLHRFLLLENNGIELGHPQDEASCHQRQANRPIKEPTMFNFSIPKNEKDVY